MNSKGSSRKRAKNPGAEAYSDASNDAHLEVSVIGHARAMSKSPPSVENRVLDGLGAMPSVSENEAPNEASTIANTSVAGGTRATWVELVTMPNGRLCKKSCESGCLENNHRKK